MPHDDSSEQTAARDVMGQGAAHLAVLARAPRAAGSAAEREAREYCARVLRDAGFDVTLEPFEYSQVPGRYGTPVGGAIAWTHGRRDVVARRHRQSRASLGARLRASVSRCSASGRGACSATAC